MRQQLTSEQLKAWIRSAEQRLEDAIAASLAHDPLRKTIIEDRRGEVHDAMVSLVTLFRDHAAGSAEVAGLIAREYANCIDGTPETPTVACIRHVLGVVGTARERQVK